jgi:hypothetical protein
MPGQRFQQLNQKEQWTKDIQRTPQVTQRMSLDYFSMSVFLFGAFLLFLGHDTQKHSPNSFLCRNDRCRHILPQDRI